MNNALLYHVSMGLVGLSLSVRSVPDLVANDSSISLWLMAIGGIGLVLGSVVNALRGPDDFDPGRLTWFVVLGAILSLGGMALSLLP